MENQILIDYYYLNYSLLQAPFDHRVLSVFTELDRGSVQ